jgi:hypothetical protein
MGLNLQDLGLELNLMLNAVRLILNTDLTNDDRSPQQENLGGCNPDSLIRLASYHGLIPWLAEYWNNEDRLINTADFEFSHRLQSITKVQRFNSERQNRIAAELSQLLDENGVSNIVFKGPALFQQIYPSCIKSRTADDLDILVSPESMSKALSILQSENYSANNESNAQKVAQFVAKHSAWYRGRDIGLQSNTRLKHSIDLHWKIADDFSFSSDTNKLLSNRVILETPYGKLATLPLQQHFVYLCSHGYSDYFFRLNYLVEVYLTMTRDDFNKREVLTLAAYHGVSDQVSQTMNLASWLFDPNGSDIDLTEYGQLVIHRLISTKGFTPRMHPNKGVWTRTDKNKHLLRQVKNRSSKSYWFSPIIARTKITHEQLSHWQLGRTSIFKLLLNGILKKLSPRAGKR